MGNKRYILAFDPDNEFGVCLRKTLCVTHDDSAYEVRYDAKPVRWNRPTAERLLKVLQKRLKKRTPNDPS